MSSADYDIAIIGGGINGIGIARDAAGRGLKVILCEQDDLAAHTSSASTKLIHGGLRYLEQFEFQLVRESLREREILLRSAPYLVRPVRLVMPHVSTARPAWLLRLGLFLYDRLGEQQHMAPANAINLREHSAGAALKEEYRKAFTFSDCQAHDARLVIINALDAKRHGAEILPRTRVVRAHRESEHWRLELAPAHSVLQRVVTARVLINAAGPWAVRVLDNVIRQSHPHQLQLVKGSHILIKRRFEHDFGYLFQNHDKRIVFALPYAQHFTLIGTTESHYDGDLNNPQVSSEDIDYLCQAVNHYFQTPITAADIVWQYAGIRPLASQQNASLSSISRDYQLVLDGGERRAALLSVFGGKLTTYRRLAEEAIDKLQPILRTQQGAWTSNAKLPGADMDDLSMDEYQRQLRAQFTWLSPNMAARFTRTYGSLAKTFLQPARSLADLGNEVLPEVYAAEINYLRQHEWAETADDILWRRTQLGLSLDTSQRDILQAWLETNT